MRSLYSEPSGRIFDDELELAPVRQQAEVLAVAARQADLVEQSVGVREIVLRPGVAQLGLVERAARQHRVGAGLRQAEIHDLVDLAPVDGERKRAAEARVAQQRRASDRREIEIGIERHLRARCRLPQPHLEMLAPLRCALEEGVVVEAEVARLQVGLAGAGSWPG